MGIYFNSQLILIIKKIAPYSLYGTIAFIGSNFYVGSINNYVKTSPDHPHVEDEDGHLYLLNMVQSPFSCPHSHMPARIYRRLSHIIRCLSTDLQTLLQMPHKNIPRRLSTIPMSLCYLRTPSYKKQNFYLL